MAAPRPPGSALLDRLRSRWWALLPPLSIAVVLAAVALYSGVADFLTYLALVAVPPLSAAGLGWFARGGRPAVALLVPPLFALAWAAKEELGGETAALALSATACITLGWLLASVVAPRWLKLGIYATAAVDAYLVAAELLQSPNAVINAAAPGIGLPQLQLVSFGSARMGFADLFVAALLGAVLARRRPIQLRAAAIAAVVCVGFDFLFFAFDLLPATVPLAIALALVELSERFKGA